jgi:HEPN domain-containing protein
MRRGKYVRVLMAKAAEDEWTFDKLVPDADAPLSVIGFHAQQAAEKLVKAVIGATGDDYPLTHEIGELIEAARTAGAPVPPELDLLDELSVFAVRARYHQVPSGSAEHMDHPHVRQLIRDLRAWVEGFIEERLGSDEGQAGSG